MLPGKNSTSSAQMATIITKHIEKDLGINPSFSHPPLCFSYHIVLPIDAAEADQTADYYSYVREITVMQFLSQSFLRSQKQEGREKREFTLTMPDPLSQTSGWTSSESPIAPYRRQSNLQEGTDQTPGKHRSDLKHQGEEGKHLQRKNKDLEGSGSHGQRFHPWPKIPPSMAKDSTIHGQRFHPWLGP
jgi:hypothetical protein